MREVYINTRTLYQAYHHTTALPLSLELWPPADVLPLGAKSVGLRCGNQSQPTKHRLGKRLLIQSSQVRGWSRRDIQPHGIHQDQARDAVRMCGGHIQGDPPTDGVPYERAFLNAYRLKELDHERRIVLH